LHGYPARRIRDRGGHTRLADFGESDGEDAGEERADPPPTWPYPSAPDPGPGGRDSGVERSRAGDDSGASGQIIRTRCGGPDYAPGEIVRHLVFMMSGPISEKFVWKL
jgi:hypothetical protein